MNDNTGYLTIAYICSSVQVLHVLKGVKDIFYRQGYAYTLWEYYFSCDFTGMLHNSVKVTTGKVKFAFQTHLDLPELGSQTATVLWVYPRRPPLPQSSRVSPWHACWPKPGSATPPPFTQDGRKNENAKGQKNNHHNNNTNTKNMAHWNVGHMSSAKTVINRP